MTAIEIPTPDPRAFDDTTRPFAEAIAHRYAIKRMIGRGGMGLVFLARDQRLDRLVAIKTLPPHLASDAALRERFLRETRTAGAMSHPNIVPIHGADEIDGHVFFVMSYVEGESLASLIGAQRRLEPAVVARYLRDVASALAHAHRRGIVHRDIKAENILIERASDRAMVTDFGIARLADATPLTATGQVLGTVYYVSPEQVAGEAVDARGDIYSLGVVGFYALTGTFPFDADVASAVLVAHVTKPAPAVATVNPDVPAPLAAIIDRCLAKDPAARYATADDLLAAIDAALPSVDLAKPARVQQTLISESEAQAVWQRAAELQAATGLHPRPEPIARVRDAARDRERKSGYAVDEIRAAAAEAGIDETYVRHALMEHGLIPGGKTPAPSPVEMPVVRRSAWAGVPLRVVHETAVQGEIAPRDLGALINTIRDETGSLGKTYARSREIAWASGRGSGRLEVTVIPAEGTTTVRVVRSVKRNAALLMTASLSFLGGITLPAVVATLMEFGMDDEIGVFVGLLAGVAVGIKSGRVAIRWYHKRVADRAKSLSDALVAKIRERLE